MLTHLVVEKNLFSTHNKFKTNDCLTVVVRDGNCRVYWIQEQPVFWKLHLTEEFQF